MGKKTNKLKNIFNFAATIIIYSAIAPRSYEGSLLLDRTNLALIQVATDGITSCKKGGAKEYERTKDRIC